MPYAFLAVTVGSSTPSLGKRGWDATPPICSKMAAGVVIHRCSFHHALSLCKSCNLMDWRTPTWAHLLFRIYRGFLYYYCETALKETVPSPCLLVFVVAYHSLPNFLVELRLSHFITGLKDWNKDCLFLVDWYLFFFSISCAVFFKLSARLPFSHLFLQLSHINVFFFPPSTI